MTKATKRLALKFAKGRSRRTFFKYLLDYGWTQDEVEDMWEYAFHNSLDRYFKIIGKRKDEKK